MEGKKVDIFKFFEDLLMDQAKEMLVNMFTEYANNYGKPSDFSKLLQTMKEYSSSFCIRSMEHFIQAQDEFYARVLRDKENIVITHKRSKLMLSELGDIRIYRRRYKDLSSGATFYAVDELMNIDKKQRLDKGLQAKILELSTKKSYNQAALAFDSKITKQTAINIAKRNFDNLNNTINEKHKTPLKVVNHLYIEADEDHIHMLNKGNRIVKLIYVHEGYQIDNISKKRVLVNPRYFCTTKLREGLWSQVKRYIERTYSPGYSISIHGDGARWIKKGLMFFPNAKYNLDRFHVQQAITKIAKNDKIKRNIIIDAIKNKDIKTLETLYWGDTYDDYYSSEYPISISYLINNLEYIDLEDKNICCSAEGHVSHVLSSRMSSRPMGWTINGSNTMSMLRAYLYNKGDFFKIVKFTKKRHIDFDFYDTINSEIKANSDCAFYSSFTSSIDELNSRILENCRKLLNNNQLFE